LGVPCADGAATARQAPARVALLIGNQGYTDAVGPLKKPHKDISLVGKALGEVGFARARAVRDGIREDMLFVVHDHAVALSKAGRGAVGFIDYTGQGIAIGADLHWGKQPQGEVAPKLTPRCLVVAMLIALQASLQALATS
jgi:Caspase domain